LETQAGSIRVIKQKIKRDLFLNMVSPPFSKFNPERIPALRALITIQAGFLPKRLKANN
jgi:hypothetical protein